MLEVLSIYTVNIQPIGGVKYKVTSVGDSDDENNAYRLSEMAMQMNFTQEGKSSCIVCKTDGITGPCGHLTFKEVI